MTPSQFDTSMAALADLPQKTPPRTFVSASVTAPYKPKAWAPARANADQHLQVKSLGLLSGKASS